MTISSTTRRWDYTGAGATDTFAYTTRIRDDDHLKVTETDTDDVETVLTKTTDYTVTGVGNDTGGNVVLVAGNLTLNYTLTIEIVEPLTQTTDIRNQGSFFPETHEDTFDHLVRLDQQQQGEIDRSVKLPTSITTSEFDPELPTDLDGTQSSLLMTNSAGDGWADAADWPTKSDITNAGNSGGIQAPYGLNNLGLATSVAASALTISLKQADGATDPASGTGAVLVYFRDGDDAASGQIVSRSVTSALSVVVPSTATLGHDSNVADEIYVYAIDNAGTVELAVSSSTHFQEGTRRSTTAMTTGSDDAATLYSTSARTNVGIRLIGTMRSNQTTAGTWDANVETLTTSFLFRRKPQAKARAADFIPKHNGTYKVDTTSARSANLPAPKNPYQFTIIDNDGTAGTNNITLVRNGSEKINGVAANFTLRMNYGVWKVFSEGTNWLVVTLAGKSNDEVSVATGNGHGSSNTRIRRFTNTRKATGSSITYADSAANGGSFTINEDGIYAIQYTDGGSVVSVFGISVSSSNLSIDIQNITYADGNKGWVDEAVGVKINSISWTGNLVATDIVRAHTDSAPDNTAAQGTTFTITKIL